MQKYRRISGWDYRQGRVQQHLIIAGIPALPPERIDSFKQALELGYFDMIKMYGIDKPKNPDEVGIKARVQFRNETMPIAISRRGFTIYRKRLVPYVMEVRAKIPRATYNLNGPQEVKTSHPNVESIYFDELERIVDTAIKLAVSSEARTH